MCQNQSHSVSCVFIWKVCCGMMMMMGGKMNATALLMVLLVLGAVCEFSSAEWLGGEYMEATLCGGC